jgi:uncharacterized protein
MIPMMHPDAELRYIGETIGYGLFARRPIPRGTITWAMDELDQRFTESQIAKMDEICREQVDRYAYVDSRGIHVLCWDHGRYVNHSCDPNCLSAGFDFEFAVRDIETDEQICDDYGLLNLTEEMECHCGSVKCRGGIHPRDSESFANEWDLLVHEAFPAIARVPQPLWPLVAERDRIESALAGITPVPSCRAHFAAHAAAALKR